MARFLAIHPATVDGWFAEKNATVPSGDRLRKVRDAVEVLRLCEPGSNVPRALEAALNWITDPKPKPPAQPQLPLPIAPKPVVQKKRAVRPSNGFVQVPRRALVDLLSHLTEPEFEQLLHEMGWSTR